jgi:NAD(P)-dependent dehydrogenase (short-subunit alcohol dehydrogenase family)
MAGLRKNYLVTGSSSGIGKALTKSLLDSGCNVLGIARDDSKVKDIVEQYPDSFLFKSIDLANRLESSDVIDKFIARYGKFNGLIFCAGKEETMPIGMYNRVKLDSIFNVNFNAPFELLRLMSKKKVCEEMASFVFLSSVMGELGQPGKTGYCSSKAALLGLVRAAALELSQRKIRVNAVSPGVVDTPMSQQLFSVIDDQNKRKIIDMHPLGLGEIEDVVPLILFLLSDESRWLTGQNIKIDGGYSVQ